MGAVGSSSDSRPPSPATSIASQLKGLGVADFAVAIYDYASQNEDELDLREGEKYMVLNDQSPVDGWIKVQNERKAVGLVPSNYLKIQIGDTLSQKSMSKSIESTKSSVPIIRQVKALYDYQAASADELTFRAGDVIQVTKEADDGWWEGKEKEGRQTAHTRICSVAQHDLLHCALYFMLFIFVGSVYGQQGVFPSNYVAPTN